MVNDQGVPAGGRLPSLPANTIREPSGDQDGSATGDLVNEITVRRSLPFEEML
jgi:hypothetical protein